MTLTVHYQQLERIKQCVKGAIPEGIRLKTMFKRIAYYVIFQRQNLHRLHSLKSINY